MSAVKGEFYRTFIEQSTEGIWCFELSKPLPIDKKTSVQRKHIFQYGYLAECNDALAKMYGFTHAGEILGKKLSDFMPDDLPENIEHIDTFITSSYVLQNSESQERDNQGNTKYFLNNFFGIVENGLLLRAWGTQRDITARKNIEKERDHLLLELKKKNALLDAVFENAPIGLGLLDEELRFIRVNKALAEINGVQENEHVGIQISTLLPDFTKVEKTFRTVLKTGNPIKNQIITGRTPATESERSWLISSFPIRLGEKTTAVGTVCEEITDSVEAETERQTLLEQLAREREELAAQEERYRLAIDAGKVGTWDWNIQSDHITWSDRIYQFNGIQPGGFEGTFKEYIKFIHPEDRELLQNAVTEAIENKKPFAVEMRTVRPDGSIRWRSTRGRVLYDKTGKAERMLGATVDITKQKELDIRKDEFLTVASHELKTPLTSIKGFTQLAHRMAEKQGDTKTEQYLSKSLIYIDRLNALIADLLDISRIQAGRLQFNMSTFSFDEMIHEAVEGAQHTTSHILKVIGETKGSFHGDRDRLEQVLANLLSNAIKYSPDAEHIEVKLSATKQNLCASVRDFGIGIPPESLEKIFERFYRAEEAAEKFTGLGIGLFISKQIAERHGGSIQVESEKNKGTTFTLILPRE